MSGTRRRSTARFAVNNDGAPVPYAAAWERAEMPYTTRRRWAAPAPAVPVAAPAVTLVAPAARAGGRRLRLRIATNGAETVALIAPPEARLRAAGARRLRPPLRARQRTRDKYYRPLHRPRLRRRGARPDRRRRASRSSSPSSARAAACRRSPRRWSAPGRRTARAQYGPDATIAIGRCAVLIAQSSG